MYRLLILSDNQKTIDRLTSLKGWETVGFSPPQIFTTKEETIEYLQHHIVDVIALDDLFLDFSSDLISNYDNIPIISVAKSDEAQMSELREIYRLLGQVHGDHTDDSVGVEANFDMLRHRLFKKIICGAMPSESEATRQLLMLRSTKGIYTPCVVAKLYINDTNQFLSNRWHYGSERLEYALRNFFGKKHDDMSIHIAIVSPTEATILFHPLDESVVLDTNKVRDFTVNVLEEVKEYLGFDLELISIDLIPGIVTFIEKKEA